ncbi:MAG: ATP-binding protein [Armatimonadota bacterium]
MDALKQKKIVGFKRKVLAKLLRSDIGSFVSFGLFGVTLTSFIFFSMFSNISLLKEQKRLEDYKSLKLVESQVNGKVQAEFSKLALASIQASNIESKSPASFREKLLTIGGTELQFWILNKSGSGVELVSDQTSRSNDNPMLQEFVASNLKRIAASELINQKKESILAFGNITILEGEKSVAMVLPVVLPTGQLIGAVTAKEPISSVQQYLPERTCFVNPDATTIVRREGVPSESLDNQMTSNGTSSLAAAVHISKSVLPWRIRAFHSPDELWSKPEIKETLNFHLSLIVISWVAIYILVNSGIKTRSRQRKLIGSLAQKIIWITNEEGEVHYVLGKVRDRLGWSEDDFHDVELGLFVHVDDRQSIIQALKNAQSLNPTDELLEIRFENKDREFRWYEVSITNMINIPEINGIVVTAHDIEDRMRSTAHILASKRAAEKANEAKSEFLSRMSHELRTPLNAILGFGQLLEMEAISDRQAENVDQILIAGRHLLGLVNDILDIARIETRKVNLSFEQVNLQEVIDESCSLLSPLASKSHVKLIVEESSVSDIMSDRQRLKQIILNLLSNGIKYNKAKGEVRISMIQQSDGIKVSFSDTGVGIEQRYLDRVFTPFDRLGSDNAQVEGTGLGLALSKTLVDAMGATLDVESEYGSGSTFTLKFPETAIVQPTIELELKNGGQGDNLGFLSSNSLKVLLIEDNIVNLRYISKVIKKLDDVELMSAKEGGIGIELAQLHLPDLILLDLDLPDINGLEVLESILEDPNTSKTHVIVMSAETNPHIVERAISMGAKQYVSKPVDISSLFVLFNEEKKAA